jgi:hypothetical protein
MREAKIILPDNVGTGEHNTLREQLCLLFGGFTATAAIGAWVDGIGYQFAEAVTVYTVAMSETWRNHARLRTLAEGIAVSTGEECIYTKYADGFVELVTAPTSK